ncbi:hypothetical protein EDB84DRAFT_1484454 [Lactarius hengduanensis]|nr:hypothetical protein EDB84DRAFT_1484454 [Lactarius hengduanensis]
MYRAWRRLSSVSTYYVVKSLLDFLLVSLLVVRQLYDGRRCWMFVLFIVRVTGHAFSEGNRVTSSSASSDAPSSFLSGRVLRPHLGHKTPSFSIRASA